MTFIELICYLLNQCFEPDRMFLTLEHNFVILILVCNPLNCLYPLLYFSIQSLPLALHVLFDKFPSFVIEGTGQIYMCSKYIMTEKYQPSPWLP